MNEWISVNDRLPDLGVEVLGYIPHKTLGVYYLAIVDDNGDWFSTEDDERLGKAIGYYITLPKPPKE